MIPSCCRCSRAAVLVALVSVGVGAMMAGAYAQQQPARGGAAPVAGGARAAGPITANLTGKGAFIDSSDMSTSRLQFEAGARTYWHTHTSGQLLLVEVGKGRLQEVGSAPRDLLLGQPVLTKAGVMHWHGAAPDQGATQFSAYNGSIEWKDAVTDEEYLGKRVRKN